MPDAQAVVVTPRNRSISLVANWRASGRWSVPSTCTAKWRALWKTSKLSDARARLQSTSGGSSDSDEKLLTVMPNGLPSVPSVVTIVTPVAK